MLSHSHHVQEFLRKTVAMVRIDGIVEGGAGAGFQKMIKDFLRFPVTKRDRIFPDALHIQPCGGHFRFHTALIAREIKGHALPEHGGITHDY